MGRLDDEIGRTFLAWEQLGRGYLPPFELPVHPEPPFRRFAGYHLKPRGPVDDGRTHTAFSAWWERNLPQPSEVLPEPEEAELDFELWERDSLVEVHLSFPDDFTADPKAFEDFLTLLGHCRDPVTFEVFGSASIISPRFVASVPDAAFIVSQLEAYFPEIVASLHPDSLREAFLSEESAHDTVLLNEFALDRPFFIPLGTPRRDIWPALAAALDSLAEREVALLQILFEPATHPWRESVRDLILNKEGRPVFNDPDLVRDAEAKLAHPLYGAVIRIAAQAPVEERASLAMERLAAVLGLLGHPRANELRPIGRPSGDEDPSHPLHDLIFRQGRRFGILLNRPELLALVRFPSPDVHSRKLDRVVLRTKAAPPHLLAELAPGGLQLGENPHRGESPDVFLSVENRLRHLHVIGASGTGKSNFLLHLIAQDMERGQGIAVLDPHGDLIDAILGMVPPSRIDDVILLDPSDETAALGLNILSAHSEIERTLLASDLVSVFQRLSTSWGDQMTVVLQNAILAFLESSRGGSLLDLRRFLLDTAVRKEFLKTVTDPEVVFYWEKGFPALAGNKSIGPLVTRLEQFLAPKPIRNIVAQRQSAVDFNALMDGGKIFLARLSQGAIGRENAYLLGSLLVTKLQQMVMSRQRQEASLRRPFWLYIDEFHNFITSSMAEILSGARKYGLGMVLAHQNLQQLRRDEEVSSSVLSNAGTRVVFRVGDHDAKNLEPGFSFFNATDLLALGIGHAICRVERNDHDFNISVPFRPAPPDAANLRLAVIERSRQLYATPREEIQAQLDQAYAPSPTKEKEPAPPVSEAKSPAPTSPPPSKEKAAPVSQPASPPPVEKPIPAAPPVATPPTVPASPPPLPPVEAKPKAAPPVLPLPLPGIGGDQHKKLQDFIKRLAQGLGYHAAVEGQIPGGKGLVDVLLTKDKRQIALEISITTPVDHEIGNLRKCLDADFGTVVMVSPDRAHLARIRAAALEVFPSTQHKTLLFYAAEDLADFFGELEAIHSSSEETIRGYKVKTSYDYLTEAERQARREVIAKQLAKIARRAINKEKRNATDSEP